MHPIYVNVLLLIECDEGMLRFWIIKIESPISYHIKVSKLQKNICTSHLKCDILRACSCEVSTSSVRGTSTCSARKLNTN